MAKMELQSAFWLIPFHPDDWNLLGIYWQAVLCGYVPPLLGSKVPLTFSISYLMPLNGSILITMAYCTSFTYQTTSWLSDPSQAQCLTSFSTLLRVFMSLKANLVASKTLGPSQVLEFMGIELDSTRMEAHLAEDKLTCTQELLNSHCL